MTEQTTTETLPTPAQDHWNAAIPAASAAKRTAIADETRWLEKQPLSALKQIAQNEKTSFVKSTDNKATIIRKIAEDRWHGSNSRAEYKALRILAHREQDVLCAMKDADTRVERAREDVRKVAEGDQWFLAESLANVTVQAAYAVESRRAWGSVKRRILDDGAEPLAAVETVAKEVTRRALSEARDGVGRSTSPAHRLASESSHQGTLRWVDEVRRYVPSLDDLFKW